MNDWFFEDCLVEKNHSKLINSIKSGKVGIEDRDCIDRTPLIVALDVDESQLVKPLLELGANPSSITNDGNTPLSLAIQCGDFNSMKLLVDAGADIELRSRGLFSPFVACCMAWKCFDD